VTTTTWLEMRDPAELRRSASRTDVDLRLQTPDPALNRQLYADVGRDFQWIDRLVWSDAEWHEYVHQPGIETWVMWAGDTPAGYFELLRHDDDRSVQIAYFGLTPQFVGKGLGGALLTAAVERAWALEATRVWLHTSSKDHPHALANYKARGFRAYRFEESP
jgi:GNAT superfamily N-acetyltransferase